MRPPTPRQIPTVVCVRLAVPNSTPAGDAPGYVNTLHRANVQKPGAVERTIHGLEGSSRRAEYLFGRDPGVQAGDLILEVPSLAADPADPASGALWVNTADGDVKLRDGGTTWVLASYSGLYYAPLEFGWTAEEDLGGGIGTALIVAGPAEDSARLGLQYRVQATELA